MKIILKGEIRLNQSLVDLLREGGYILFARHGEATVGVDQPYFNFQNCYTQRNLSELGKRQAIYYGQILRDLRIPFQYPVQTSPFCRAIGTGQLAIGWENVQVDPFGYDIYKLSGNIPPIEQERILATLQSKLEAKPILGSNKVMIYHSFPQNIGLGEIPNMGTVIIKPLGQGEGYEIVARLSLADLANLQ